MENNRVKVKIYGQEYVVAGEKSKEEIIQVAAHVKLPMRQNLQVLRLQMWQHWRQ